MDWHAVGIRIAYSHWRAIPNLVNKDMLPKLDELILKIEEGI